MMERYQRRLKGDYMTLKLGRLPLHSEETHPRVHLKDHRFKEVAPVALPIDWFARVTAWGMLLNDQQGDCVDPETLVLTADLQWLPAGELEVGDSLLAFEEFPVPGTTHGRYFTPSVVEKNDRVIRPCYELRFDDGTVVTSSSGHLWLSKSQVQGRLGTREWVRTEDLRCDDVNNHQVYKPLETWSTSSSWDSGYAAAGFDGEGHVDRRGRAHRVSFAQTDNSMLEQMRSSLKTLGFEFVEKLNNRHRLLRVDGTPRKTLHSLEINRKRDMLRFLGTVRPRRLMDNFYEQGGAEGAIGGTTARLVSKTFVGEREVVMLDTSSRTYFANGLASHNCTAAGLLHLFQAMTTYAGDPISPVDNDALSLYERFGYKPGDPSTDQGANEQDVLTSVVTDPICGEEVLLFAQVDVQDQQEIESALATFGPLYLGINCPQSMREQFGDSQVIDYVPDSPIEGGHCIILVGVDTDYLYVVTWGQCVKMTWTFWQNYTEEAWAIVTRAWLEANGETPSGFNLTGLQAAFQALPDAPAPQQAVSRHENIFERFFARLLHRA